MIKNYFYILLFLLVCSIPSYAQEGQWQIAGYLPRGFCGAEAVVVDSVIYILGGINDSLQTETSWIYSFNPSTNELTFLTKMKRRRSHFMAGASDSLIYIAGGEQWSFDYPQPNGLVECYNTITNTVTSVDSSQKFNRRDASLLIKDNTMYVAGGAIMGPGNNPYLFEYSIPQKSFTFIGNYYMGAFPKEQAISFIQDKIYLMGGASNTITKDIFRYDLNTHYFKKQQYALMNVRAGMRSAYFSKDSTLVMLIGGHNERVHALNTVEVYNFADSMHVISLTMPSLNYSRKEFMAVNYGNYVYVFGGRNEYGSYVKAIERYQYLTAVQDVEESPVDYKLVQNYPNPFNASTIITYSLASRSNVSIKVYDILGKQISELVDGEEQPGEHSLTFNGSGLPSGVYYYRITVNGYSSTRKMILLK